MAATKTEYLALEAGDIEDLKEMVSKRLDDGWTLYGNLIIVTNQPGHVWPLIYARELIRKPKVESPLEVAGKLLLSDYAKFMDSDETYPEYHHEAVKRVRLALEQSESVLDPRD
ncbi:DUF1737 domain-containing protein [Zavarzinella formosa]|uniref:DUF1737 domain-containing protein n=1 Tax=Zavarzinella formosa TaxID=360055 RepID=UPI000374DF34|nr:DUF1737 domain-containing protein [Zavarzinella formosa]